MPLTKNAYSRFRIIDQELKRNKYKTGYPTLNDLLDKLSDHGFEISKPTLEKDLHDMKNAPINAPIIYDRNQHAYHYEEDYTFDSPLTDEELRMLYMAVRKLRMFKDSINFRHLTESLDQVAERIELNERGDIDEVEKYVHFEHIPKFVGREFIPIIFDAIYEGRIIRFEYQKFDGVERKQRELEPYVLREFRNRWYVLGKENGETRIFGLDRMSELTFTSRYFEKDEAFYEHMKTAFDGCIGVYAFGDERKEVVLSFTKEQGEYIKTLMIHRSQEIIFEDENELRIKLNVQINREFLMEAIFRYAEQVKVLSPPELVKQVYEIYTEVFARYLWKY